MKIRKSAILFIALIVSLTIFIRCTNNGSKDKEAMTDSKTVISSEDNKVRLSLITVDSTQLDEYSAFLKEEIEASMRLEPGVLMLYAISEKGQPNKVTILEIYADEEAYQKHIKTPHFIKYKEGTLSMVQSLKLIDTNPLIQGLIIKNKQLWKK